MVTPTWLNGAGCATAVPAASVKASNIAINTFVFTDASLLSWISVSWRCLNAISADYTESIRIIRAIRGENLVRPFSHQRHRRDQLRPIRPPRRAEFLRTSTERLGGVQISTRVHRELVHAPECARERSVSSPRIQQFPVQIVFQKLVADAVGNPQILVGRHLDVIRLPDVRPHVEELPIFVEHLDAAVCSIGDIDAPVLVDRHRVYRVELAGAGAGCSPRQEELSIPVELDDARVRVSVGDEEGAVGKPGDVRGPTEMLVVIAGNACHAQGHQELLSVVAELEDLLTHVVDNPYGSLGIVRADLDRVRTAAAFKKLVPLGPRFDQFSIGVDDDDAVAQLRLLTGCLAAKRTPRAIEAVGQLVRELQLAAIRHADPVG